MAISALLQLGHKKEKLTDEINFLKNSSEKLNSNYTFCTNKYGYQFNSTPALNVALYLETLNWYNQSDAGQILTDDQEKSIMDKIMETASQKFNGFSEEFKNLAIKKIKDTIKGNTDKQMSMMAYYMRTALGEKGKIFSDELVAKMGLANIFFWSAFIIYDDFWDKDEKADPQILPTANLFARNYVDFFTSILPPDTGFNKFFHELMDKLDAANTWETIYCRAKVENNKFFIPESLPNYDNYDKKYEPASGHILGPIAMLVQLGYNLNSDEVKNLISYFKNYLIAMQLNDDAHDWQEDIQRGHLSTVVVMLLKDWKEKYPDKKEIDLKEDLEKLQQIFWFKTVIQACQTTIFYSNKSRGSLQKMTIFENISPLKSFCNMTENVAKKALNEQKKSTDFLKEFKI